MALLKFNAAEVPPAQPMEAMPPAWYNAKVTDMTLTPTKDHAVSKSEYWKTEFTILDGKFAGRKVWTNYNVKNTNPKAVEIAYEQLSALCHAVDRIDIENTEELYGLPLQIKLSLSAATAEYDAKNEVKGYKAIDGEGGAASGPAGVKKPSGPTKPAPKAAPSKPAPKAAPSKPAAHDPLKAALADGWAVHPDDDAFYWKEEEEVLETADMLALYPAPVAKAAPSKPAPKAAPTKPAATAAEPADDAAEAGDGDEEKAPWEED